MSDSNYIVSARKYRPATFKSVVGQKNLTETLKNAIDSGRLAQAYLFCGPRGVGKTSCARIFAKTINCLSPTPDGEACGVCDSCKSIEEGNSFNIIELDAASNNSVDDIRSLTEQVNIPPSSGKYRVFIIDEVHMLSSQAFNAFLKTLEEPPKYVVFILATTEKHKVIPTILSRCQIYDFKRITIQDMVEHLQYVAESENIMADIPSLNVIARKADGAMRDALSIFDQVAASSIGNITYESTLAALNVLDYEFYFRLVEAFHTGNVPEALLIYQDIRERGFDSLFFVNGLGAHIRDLMVAFSPQTCRLLEVADDVAKRYTDQARKFPVDWLYAAMKIINDCDYSYRTASNKQFLVELTLIRLCQLLNPPKAPFDRVDNDTIPIRDITAPHISEASPYYGTSTSSRNFTTTVKTDTEQGQMVAREPDPPMESKSSSLHSATEDTHGIQQSATDNSNRKVRRNSSIRLGEENTVTSGSPLVKKRTPVTMDGFMVAWNEFIESNPQLHLLISAMREHQPIQEADDIFSITVDHPAQLQAFELGMTQLSNFIKEKLQNDFIIITPKVDDSVEIVRQLPPAELLKEIMANNPPLAGFIAESDMEIV